MKYQIDQSGKIEQTNINTVLAYSNDNVGAVILRAKDKRKLQEMFREVAAPRLFINYTFSALIICLLKPLKISHVTVDKEYTGNERIIGSLVKAEITTEIDWKYIGKSSKAHNVAYKVFSKKLAIGKYINAEEIWKLAKKITGGYLKTGLSPANRYSAPVNKYMLLLKNKKSRVHKKSANNRLTQDCLPGGRRSNRLTKNITQNKVNIKRRKR